MDKKLFSLTCAILCSFIWGTGFIAQDMGMDHIGPFTFSAGTKRKTDSRTSRKDIFRTFFLNINPSLVTYMDI